MTTIGAAVRSPVNTGVSGGARQPCASPFSLAAACLDDGGGPLQARFKREHEIAAIEAELDEIASRHGVTRAQFEQWIIEHEEAL
jgi:aryl-alcohol dehydrogenase-like predicted oxidoreductase